MESVKRNHRSLPVIYMMIVLGTGIMGVAIKCIYDPISLVTGGFSGVSIMVKKVTEEMIEEEFHCGLRTWH